MLLFSIQKVSAANSETASYAINHHLPFDSLCSSQSEFVKGFIPGLIKSISYELYLLLSGQIDSWFYDSPLSHYGIEQIDKLATFLSKPGTSEEETKYLHLLNNTEQSPMSSVLVSSNLRRALSTVCIGFRSRLADNPSERVIVHPSLQEISRNPDTLSITPPHTPVTASWIEKTEYPHIQPILTSRVDMSHHTGNKPLNTNGLIRMSAFCEFVFTLPEAAVIAGGHSLWFRSFFQCFLPRSSTHIAKKKKMVNGGAVAFELRRTYFDGKAVYDIDEESVRVVYGGF